MFNLQVQVYFSLQLRRLEHVRRHAGIIILKTFGLFPPSLFLSKITEKVVLQQLLAYLTEHNLIRPPQSAYRPLHSTETALLKTHHSTETALLKITNDILLALDSGYGSLLTLLEPSAAFDTNDHCILLNRLHHMYSISATALSWFSSYLTNRTQSVFVDDNVSQVSSLSYDVPQGSVLGSIFFILYTKPLSDLSQCHSIESQSFADDTRLQVLVPPPHIQSAVSSLETCLSDIQT